MTDRLFQLEQEIAQIKQKAQQGLSIAQAYEATPQTNRLLALEQSLTLLRETENQSTTNTHTVSFSQSEYSQPFDIMPRGYSFVNDLDGDIPLPPADCLPPLTFIEIARLNEAFARSKQAAQLARDCVLEIARLAALPHVLSRMQQIYVDYFGTFNQARAQKVKDNFIKIFNAFDAEPEVIDHRNTDFGRNCYAATHTKHLPPGAKVKIWIGRDFFGKGRPYPKGADKTAYIASYTSTSDATVGTLIHEFSHGVFHAVDAPPLKPDGSWVLAPIMAPGDQYGASPINSIQCSTREDDKRLASRFPDISLRNADNYGQFACEILLANGK